MKPASPEPPQLQGSPHGEALRALRAVESAVGSIVLGKRTQVRLCMACLLARGHLLIEDVPGVGKTTLAHALAKALGLSFSRIQFTSDLLPADVLGVSIFDRDSARFRFQHGPIFAQLVLADEINRAPPKSQSALLEAMEEHQVTLDGETHALPEPFFVVATQNPQDQAGTFALPESQLDRFLMRVQLGYPDAHLERELLHGVDRHRLIAQLPPALTLQELIDSQNLVPNIHVSPALLDYAQALIAFSRSHERFKHGLSPRAGIGLLNAARAWALLDGRDAVLPEDVQAVLEPVAEHRLRSHAHASSASAQLTEAVAIP